MLPFLDVARGYRELKDDIDAAVAKSLSSGRYIGGPQVESFESAFASYTDSRYCVGTGNGLDALRLALEACGIGPGDEVLVPSNTFIATWLAVSQVGAVPKPVEPDPYTHNVTPEALEAALSDRVRAIVPVHLYGCPAPISEIVELANRHGLVVIEDAAQAHGARWGGRRIGGHSHAATWSFYPGKNLGAFGDGGAVTTNDPELAKRVRMLGNYGSRERYIHELKGVNSRLDPLQAAILTVKLEHLDRWNNRRHAIANRYADIARQKELVVQAIPNLADPVWHLFVIRHSRRDALRRWLTDQGVETLIHYPRPPHKQSAFACELALPIAEQLANEVLSLPIGPHMTDAEIGKVVDALRAFPEQM